MKPRKGIGYLMIHNPFAGVLWIYRNKAKYRMAFANAYPPLKAWECDFRGAVELARHAYKTNQCIIKA